MPRRISRDDWSGRKVTMARANLAARTQWPVPCGRCEKPVNSGDAWICGHKKSRHAYPELTWDPDNWQVEHKHCSDSSWPEAVAERRARFPLDPTSRQSPPLPVHTHEGQGEPGAPRESLRWAWHVRTAPGWLQPYLDVPEDASPPLAMTPVHPDAVGSYGPEAIDWIEKNLDIRLRWWQRLAIVRQLEHRESGELCWRTIIESCPRRAGKSVRLRSMALWRLAVGPSLFAENQLVIHTGKDRGIVKEIHRQAYAWAMGRIGWDVRRGAGQEEVSSDYGEHRWLVRSTDSVYGYDTTMAYVDEAWAVEPAVFDEGLEPSTMERISPQSVLTSTAHRRATSLMRRLIGGALMTDDGETLLMLWAAPAGSDVGDPETWRAASPHWSEDRARLIASKYEAAMAGQADPEADDMDPMAGFEAQYLNIWRMRSRKALPGTEVVSEDAWADLETSRPVVVPEAVAVEAHFDEFSVAAAWKVDGSTVVSVTDHETAAEAAEHVRALGYRGVVSIGTSLAEDPAFRTLRKRKVSEQSKAAVAEFSRMLDGSLLHDGGEHLTTQVVALRTSPGADGPRMRSTGRTDAVKAAVWSAKALRKPSLGKPRILTASA